MKYFHLVILTLFFYSLSFLNANADIYKCISDDGSIIYKNNPCEEIFLQEILKSVQKEIRKDSDSEKELSPQVNENKELNNENIDRINLKIITDNYSFSRTELEYINSGVNFLYNYYKQIFDYKGEVSIRMIVFGDKKDFFNYQKKNIHTIYSDAGIFIPKLDEGAINGTMGSKRVIRTLLHECSHAILRKKTRTVPLWINEGLAEYFEVMEPGRNKITVGYQRSRYRDIRRKYAEGLLIPLPKYLNLNSHAWAAIERQQEEITRTMAWSVVHFLMSTEQGQQSLVKIVRDFKILRDAEPLEIIDKNLPGGINEFEKNWIRYIKNRPTIHTYKPFGKF